MSDENDKQTPQGHYGVSDARMDEILDATAPGNFKFVTEFADLIMSDEVCKNDNERKAIIAHIYGKMIMNMGRSAVQELIEKHAKELGIEKMQD